MTTEQSPEPGTINLSIEKVFIMGHAVIRDPQGNIKGEFAFGGEATEEQAKGVGAEFQK